MKTWLPIMTFSLLAFALSFGLSKVPLRTVGNLEWSGLLCGLGPLLAGLACYAIFKTPSTLSLSGGQPVKTTLIVMVVAITFVASNGKATFGANIFFAITQLLYCLGEEYGWRHYLQSAVAPLRRWLQPFVIGTIWFAWHFSWLQDPIHAMMGDGNTAPAGAVIVSAALALCLASLLLGLLMRRSHAVLLATVLHFAVKTNLPAFAAAALLVLIAALTWERVWIELRPKAS